MQLGEGGSSAWPALHGLAFVGWRPPREDCRASGPSSLFLLPRAEGWEGGSAWAQAGAQVSGQMTQERGAALGSISRGAPGPYVAIPWLIVPGSHNQDP